MIRSTNVILKYSNTTKQQTVDLILNEYLKVTQFFIDYIWNNYSTQDKIPSLMPKEITQKAETWFTARMIQASAKQASGIVRGTREKHNKRLFVLSNLTKQGKFKQARKLQQIIDKNPITKPKLKSIEAELDSRFVKIEYNKNTIFDGWLTIGSIGKNIKLQIPFKSHKALEKLKNNGKQKSGIRLSNKLATFTFELPELSKQEGKTVGVDIGMKTAFTCSDGKFCNRKLNGHNVDSVCRIISRKKKGSKGFERACRHRRNLIGYYKNQLDWQNIKQLRIEDIKYLRFRKRTSRYMSTFVYRTFFDSLVQTCEVLGVQVFKVCPTYTSQRCSRCGWTRKRNRNGKVFKCGKCGYTTDSDFNGSVNISLDLPVISKVERLRRVNMLGFFWHVNVVDEGQEFVVPAVRKL